ncbi:MAG: GyrI-like domain-containing protein [Chloroflexota bacterium]
MRIGAAGVRIDDDGHAPAARPASEKAGRHPRTIAGLLQPWFRDILGRGGRARSTKRQDQPARKVRGMAEPRGPTSKIEVRALHVRHVASVRESIARNDITEALGRIYREVNEALAKQGVEPNGAPFARYHEFGQKVDLEAGLPVASPIVREDEVKPSELPGGPAAVAVHAGPYEGLSTTYDAIEAWMKSTNRSANGGPWEVYLTDPSSEPDPTKWLTQILWPLRQP